SIIPEDKAFNQRLALYARRALLNQTAEKSLQTTSNARKINPLKVALQNPSAGVNPAIQIQKGFNLPKYSAAQDASLHDSLRMSQIFNIVLVPVDLPGFPALTKQLAALNITQIQDSAIKKIEDNAHAFYDGIIPENLPRGFYIDKKRNALCYTATPSKLPSALAPALEKPSVSPALSFEEAKTLVEDKIDDDNLKLLLNSKEPEKQKTALAALLAADVKEFNNFLAALKPAELNYILPLLAQQMILGGKSHCLLFIRLLASCPSKKISLEFLQDPIAQEAFLNPRGIKNLQKLLQLPAEQRDWWNTLARGHLQNKNQHFDFNSFFEVYTQIFLPQITEKNLSLFNPCPIVHQGHILITLNRVLDILDHAENPQEQCLNLAGLDWGSTGAHYAMTERGFKQVASCMELSNPEDLNTAISPIYNHIEDPQLSLSPWMFRFISKYWKKELRLTDIQERVQAIQNLTWTPVQKNQLLFILTCSFTNNAAVTLDEWKQAVQNCISSLNGLNAAERDVVLQSLTRSHLFKPQLNIGQLQKLISNCIELKTFAPGKDFANDIIKPLCTLLENEGYEVYQQLQERIQKTNPSLEAKPATFNIFLSYLSLIQNQRARLDSHLITMLAKLNESELTQASIDTLLTAADKVKAQHGEEYYSALLFILSQINIAKTPNLPKLSQIIKLLDTLAAPEIKIAQEADTLEKRATWFRDLILDQKYLPGCVLGSGDISKLDDLIVEALVEAVKKRKAVLDIRALKHSLQENLQSSLVPEELRSQLDRDLMPILDAMHELVTLLQSPNPKFPQVIATLHDYELKKPALFDNIYKIFIGSAKGDHLLSFIITGKRKEDDNFTNSIFAGILMGLNGLFVKNVNAFFNSEKNRELVKDLDAKTTFKWMESFNETHSLGFLFKEELVDKKVRPALKKTLLQLNTQDAAFEESILAAAEKFDETIACDVALENYRIEIEAISNYLNLLIEIKEKTPAQFNAFYMQLQTGQLARLTYQQKAQLVNLLKGANPALLDAYLNLTIQSLTSNPEADSKAIERGIEGLKALFELEDLERETQMMFFKMSLAHNLKSANPFPLSTINELKKSDLENSLKSVIIKSIIVILSHMTPLDSPELIQDLVQNSQQFLKTHPELAQLCVGLLKRVQGNNLNRDIIAYNQILQQITSIKAGSRAKYAKILTDFANNYKDDTVNIPTLLEIVKGLARLSDEKDFDSVFKLFTTPPYPIAQTLNTALRSLDSIKLREYCAHFDTNPFMANNESRPLAQHFATHRIYEGLTELKDLMRGVKLPHLLQLQLAKQLTYIETLGYTDALNPGDFNGLKKLTAMSRTDLKNRAVTLLEQIRKAPNAQTEVTQLEMLAYLREIYFRTTGLFPNTTQMLVLLLALKCPDVNLLLRITTGEGKSLNTPMLAVLQWLKGGTADVCTANRTLLRRDYTNNGEAFLKFLDIPSTVIHSDTPPSEYKLNGINYSTVEDMSLFRLAAKEANLEHLIQNGGMIHLILDESHAALLDQTLLFKLVAENPNQDHAKPNDAEWVYPLAYQFVNLPAFRNLNADTVWDEDEDLEQFRLFLNKQINDHYNGDADKQNFLLATSNTQLKQWIHASCKAAQLEEDKHFIVQPIKVKDDAGIEVVQKIVCVPLIKSTPKNGCIFTGGIQQALHARLKAERKDMAPLFVIDADPPVLASQSVRGLIDFYQQTQGCLVGISGTPGSGIDLDYLNSLLGTQAISVAPYAGDKRIKNAPHFAFSREEKVREIKSIIENLKKPLTKPFLQLNPDIAIQTIDEQEAFIHQAREALEEWNNSQTQPIILFCEDFSEVSKLAQDLEHYKEQGFKIQMTTGKETPEELEKIIKQAGRANTITIGTPQLAIGIDINPGDHPEGAVCIQAMVESERMSTQMCGRIARNGKPGQYYPIYQIDPPNSFWDYITYYLFPWIYENKCKQIVKDQQEKIQLQAALDRIYTQGIDQAQQTLMTQIDAWESLLIELYPNDPKVMHDLYLWREELLSELAHSQITHITQDNLEASIAQFKNNLNRLWDNLKEDKWVAKAQKATGLNHEQSLRLNVLKQLDLTKELNIPNALPTKGKLLEASSEKLRHYNLQSMIQDKAGAVLEYSEPPAEEKKKLQFAQIRQLLPALITDLCEEYPHARKDLNGKLPGQQRTLFQMVSELSEVSDVEITQLIAKIKPIILEYSQHVAEEPLAKQFSIRGIFLTYCKLFENAGIKPSDMHLNDLQAKYDQHIMLNIAKHLMEEFSWAGQSPTPIHGLIERQVAFDAAKRIYELAEEVKHANNPQSIQALYVGLLEERMKLKDAYLFSIVHSSPRDVINATLAAIDSLDTAPHCSTKFRVQAHDSVLSKHHLQNFRVYLNYVSSSNTLAIDPVWQYLKKTLEKMSGENKQNTTHLIHELAEIVNRFKTYPVYGNYSRQLNNLSSHLAAAITELEQEDGLKENHETSLFNEKESQFATLFKVKPQQVHIRKCSDGIQSYIEVQVEDAALQEGFTGYQSPVLTTLDKEKAQLVQHKALFAKHKADLLALRQIETMDWLLPKYKQAFIELGQLESLINVDLNLQGNNPLLKKFPQAVTAIISTIQRLHATEEIDPQLLGVLNLSQAQYGQYLAIIAQRDELQSHIDTHTQRIKDGLAQLVEIRKQIVVEQEKNLAANNVQAPSPGFFDKVKHTFLHYTSSSTLSTLQRQEQTLLSQQAESEKATTHSESQLKTVKTSLTN
ncbi:MAG: hypothetical protein EPN84_09650, partial [Legionella sp.]